MSVDMRQRIALRDLFRDRLCDAALERDRRDFWTIGPDGDRELGWMAYERLVMLEAVNAELRSRGLPDAEPDEVWRIERSAGGHCDYAAKYALHLAFLVERAQQEAQASSKEEGQ